MSLYEVLSECEENREEREKLLSLPFAPEIIKGVLTPSELTVEQLEDAIRTASYLNENSTELVEELVWKAGKDEKLCAVYFSKNDAYMEDFWYQVNEALDPVLYGELCLVYGKKRFCGERINVRKEIKDAKLEKCTRLKKCAEIGNLRLLDWVKENYPDDITFNGILTGALKGGKIPVIEWILTEYDTLEKKTGKKRELYIGRSELKESDFDIKMIKYLHSKNLLKSEESHICQFAIEKGQIETFIFLEEAGYLVWGYMCEFAATGGKLDCLKYLHETRGFQINYHTARVAIINDHLHILQYIYEKRPVIFTVKNPLGSLCLASYISHNSYNGDIGLELLRFLSERETHKDFYVAEHICFAGKVDCLRVALEKGYPISEKCSEFACLHKSTDCLKLLVEHKAPISPRCTEIALAEKNYKAVQCLNSDFPLLKEVFDSLSIPGTIHDQLLNLLNRVDKEKIKGNS